MGKIKLLLIIFIIVAILLFIIGLLSYFICKEEEELTPTEEYLLMADLTNKKIAMIIAFKDFRDEEYFTPRGIFDEKGAEVKVVSDELGVAEGADGGQAKVDIKLGDLNVADFDAVVFIGGPGSLSRLDNQDSYKIAKETVAQNKILASICISPVILAKAGVLEGKKATVWTSPLEKTPQRILEDNGAIYQDEDLVQDGNIITAVGPSAAKDFGWKIVEALLK